MGLSFELLYPRSSTPQDIASLNEHYSFFKRNWNKVFDSIGVDTRFSTDDYKKFDVHISLKLDDVIIGHHSLSFHDLKYEYTSDAHVLDALSQEARRKILRENDGYFAFLGGYIAEKPILSLDRKYSLPHLLGGLATMVFKNSLAERMITISRNSMNVDKLCLKHGGYLLCEDVKYQGERSSVFAFDHDTIVTCKEESHQNLVYELWRQYAGSDSGIRQEPQPLT
jgi:hypothetical protein